MNDELERIWEEAVMGHLSTCTKVKPQYSSSYSVETVNLLVKVQT